MKVIDITIADDHIPKERPAKRKANITVFDNSEKQCITFYPEEGMKIEKYREDGQQVKEVYCRTCGYTNLYYE